MGNIITAAMESETQTVAVSTASHETQTVAHNPPNGYKFIGIFGDSHLKTCYRFLLHTLEGTECTKDAIKTPHPNETILIDVIIGKFREYHSVYVCHKRRLFIEFVFIRSLFDSYLESKIMSHLMASSNAVYDAVFVNSALWDIRSEILLPEYTRRIWRFSDFIKSLASTKQSNFIKVLGFTFNKLSRNANPQAPPWIAQRHLLPRILGTFNDTFEHVMCQAGHSTYCLERETFVELASDGVHYQRQFYVELVKVMIQEAMIM